MCKSLGRDKLHIVADKNTKKKAAGTARHLHLSALEQLLPFPFFRVKVSVRENEEKQDRAHVVLIKSKRTWTCSMESFFLAAAEISRILSAHC